MAKVKDSKFSAAGSLLGYLYQCRTALLVTLERIRVNPVLDVLIEALDDVHFEENGLAVELIQTKHHCVPADLSDYSVEFWKTIRIWSELKKSGKLPKSVTLCLMTTAQAAEKSIAACLRHGEARDTDSAISAMKQISITSSNEDTFAGRKAFGELSELEKEELIEAIVVFDKYPCITDLDRSLEFVLWGVCEKAAVPRLLNHLEGWWYRRVIECLVEKSKVTASEIEAQIGRLRESFKDDNLPIADDVRNASPDVEPFRDWVFSKQLRLIGVGEKRIGIAAKNFYKAREQRSRWIREELLIDNDLDSYDEKLVDEWLIRFEQALDRLPDEAVEADSVVAGQGVYAWVEADASIPIKPQCREPFITRGSYQILSNRKLVGWHPRFRNLLGSSGEGEVE